MTLRPQRLHFTLSLCYARAWRKAGPRGSWTWKGWRQDTRHLPLLRRLCWARLEPERPQAGAASSRVREKERPKLRVYLYVNIYRECYNVAYIRLSSSGRPDATRTHTHTHTHTHTPRTQRRE
mgnify:CR=1 FL=1